MSSQPRVDIMTILLNAWLDSDSRADHARGCVHSVSFLAELVDERGIIKTFGFELGGSVLTVTDSLSVNRCEPPRNSAERAQFLHADIPDKFYKA